MNNKKLHFAPPRLLFCGAAVLDRLGQTRSTAVSGASNPGQFREYPGGAAFNAASIFCALSETSRPPVALATLIGSDPNGSLLAQAASDRGLTLLPQKASRTATYTAILDHEGSLMIAINDMDAYEAFDPQPALQHMKELDANDWLVLDANLPETVIKQLVAHAPCKIAAATTSRAKAQRLRSVLAKINILFSNRAEMSALLQCKDKNFASALDRSDIKQAVVTDGDKPLLVYETGASIHVPIQAVINVVDVTGAGDAVAGACLFGLTNGMSLKDAAKLGIDAAACILEVNGPWRGDLTAALNQSTKER